MTNRTPKTSKPLARAYIVFGADEHARPRAARFWARHVEPLAKAAAAMNVRLVQVSDPRLTALMPEIPPGRLHASGREFLPHVSGDTYAELAAAVLIQQPSDHPAATDEALPCTWHEVVPGRLVLARETRECGWWEAVVVDRHRDLLTLRYRDYPDHPNFVRGPSAVALIAAPEFWSRASGQRTAAQPVPTITEHADHSSSEIIMKVKVWVVSTTIPERGEGPCMPFAFGSEVEAEAHADKMLRDEWACAAISDREAGGAMPYPGDWREAQNRLVEFYGDGSWGTWEITAHDVDIGSVPGLRDSET